MYNIDKIEKIFIYVLWLFSGATQMKSNNVDRKIIYVFNRYCELPPDSYCVFENGPVFLRQCATNSNDSPIWDELNSNFAAQSRVNYSSKCLTSVQQRTVVLVRTLPNSQSPSFRDVVIFDRLHPVSCSCRQRISRPSALVDLFMLAWNNLHPLLVDPSLSFLTFEQLLKTELLVWTRTHCNWHAPLCGLFWKA